MKNDNGMKQRSRLLTAVAVLVMVFAAFATVPMVSEESDAAYQKNEMEFASGVTKLASDTTVVNNGVYLLKESGTFPSNDVDTNAYVVYVKPECTLTINPSSTPGNFTIYTTNTDGTKYDSNSKVYFQAKDVSGSIAITPTSDGTNYAYSGATDLKPVDAIYTADIIWSKAQANGNTILLDAKDEVVNIAIDDTVDNNTYYVSVGTSSTVDHIIKLTGLSGLSSSNVATAGVLKVTVGEMSISGATKLYPSLSIDTANELGDDARIEVTQGFLYSNSVFEKNSYNGIWTTDDTSAYSHAAVPSGTITDVFPQTKGTIKILPGTGTKTGISGSISDSKGEIFSFNGLYTDNDQYVSISLNGGTYTIDAKNGWNGSVTMEQAIVIKDGATIGNLTANSIISQADSADSFNISGKLTLMSTDSQTLGGEVVILKGGELVLGNTAKMTVSINELIVFGTITDKCTASDDKTVLTIGSELYNSTGIAYTFCDPGAQTKTKTLDECCRTINSLDEIEVLKNQGFTWFKWILNDSNDGTSDEDTTNFNIVMTDNVRLPAGITLDIIPDDTNGKKLVLTNGLSSTNKKELSFIIPSGTTVTLGNTSNSVTDIEVGDDIRIVVQGDLERKVTENKEGMATIDDVDGQKGTFELSSTGTVGENINVTVSKIIGDLDEAYVGGTTNGSITYPTFQKVIVEEGKTWTIKKNNVITILGTLEVNGTIEILDGGKLIIGTGSTGQKSSAIINGDVNINEGGLFEIAHGDVTASANLVVAGSIITKSASTLTVKSTMDVERTGSIASADISGFVVDTGATMTVYGYLGESLGTGSNIGTPDISVKGTLVIDNGSIESRIAEPYGGVNISLIESGASVTIQSYIIENLTASTITIDDRGLQVASIKDKTYIVGSDGTTLETNQYLVKSDNQIVVKGSENGSSAISGSFTVTSMVESEKEDDITYVDNILSMSGFLYNSTPIVSGYDDAKDIEIELSGNTVADETYKAAETYLVFNGYNSISDEGLFIGKDVKFDNDGKLVVEGYLDMTIVNIDVENIADGIFVEGKVKSLEPIDSGITGVKFITQEGTSKTPYYNFTSLDTAVIDVMAIENLNNDKTLTIIGKNVVLTDVHIISEITVRVLSEATLQIGTSDNRDVSVNFDVGATLHSSGTVDVLGSLEFSDKTDDKTNGAIIADVTVTDETQKNGSILYTNIYNALKNAEDGETVKVTKNGYVDIETSITIPAGRTLHVGSNVSGLKLYAGVTLTIDGTLYTESKIVTDATNGFSDKATNNNDKKTSAIIVNGKLVSEYKINYGAYNETTKTFPISGAYYSIEDGFVISPLGVAAQIIPEIESDIVINGPNTIDNLTISSGEEDLCNKIVVSYGAIGDVKTSLTFRTITLDGMSIEIAGSDKTYINGTIAFGDSSVKFKNICNTAGETLVISENDETIVLTGKASIKDKDSVIEIASGTVAFGTVGTDSKEFTYTSGANTATIDVPTGTCMDAVNMSVDVVNVLGTMTVGSTSNATVEDMNILGTVTVFTGDGTSDTGNLTIGIKLLVGIERSTGAQATLSGDVTLNTGAYAIITSGSNVSDETIAELEKNSATTEIYTGDVLWGIIYSNDSDLKVSDLQSVVGITDAFVSGWIDDKGQVVNNNTEVDTKSVLTAKIVTDVYKIVILGCEGITNVTVDGHLMLQSGNTFTIMADAGEHTVSYTLLNGYSGNAVLSGTGFTSGMNFVTEGTPEANSSDNGFKAIEYNLQLAGIERSTEKTDDGMNLTEILLIVLVVLIAVMAIVIAMRLMRS